MFGPQASSPFRTGTLLMVFFLSVQLTCNTTLKSDRFQEKLPKNRTSSNLTDRGQSMLRSLVTPGKRLGFPGWNPFATDIPNLLTEQFTFPNGEVITCWLGHNDEIDKCVNDKLSSFDKTDKTKFACQGFATLVGCQIKTACAYCSGDDFEKLKKFNEHVMEGLEVACANYKSWVPSFSCTNWTLIIIIIVVVVIVVILCIVALVVVCCCCMGGGGSGGRSRKRSSKRSPKSKLSKSSKHGASSRPTSRASSRR